MMPYYVSGRSVGDAGQNPPKKGVDAYIPNRPKMAPDLTKIP